MMFKNDVNNRSVEVEMFSAGVQAFFAGVLC